MPARYFALPTFIGYSTTATDDNLFHLVDTDVWFTDLNIHCYTNSVYYGDTNIGTIYGKLYAGDVLPFRNCNLQDFFFKNLTAGSNATITASGVTMTKNEMKELGIPIQEV